MKISELFRTNGRQGIVHLVVILLAITLITSLLPLSKVGGEYLWQRLGQFLLTIAAFYVHSLLLLPILLRKKKLKKYLLYSSLGFILFWVLYLWLQAWHSSEITQLPDGSDSSPLVFLRQPSFIS